MADVGRRGTTMEMPVGIVLIIVSLVLIAGIVRVVQSNMPGR
jgi:hypothetical protein